MSPIEVLGETILIRLVNSGLVCVLVDLHMFSLFLWGITNILESYSVLMGFFRFYYF